MKTIALYNIKGGVGKTAAAVNLAYLASREGNRVLIWDLDPQGATSFYFRVKPKVKGGSKAIVKRRREIDALIKGTDYENLDILPSDFSYRKMDLRLEKAGKNTRLRKILKSAADEFDYVFLDAPPSISQLSENIFRAADALIVPLLPTTLSVRTFEQIRSFCDDQKIGKGALMPFFSMVDRRKNLHKEILQDFPKAHRETLPTSIPYASAVERMGPERKPLHCFAARSAPALAYCALWEDIKDRLI